MTDKQFILLKNSWRLALIKQAEAERFFFTRLYQVSPQHAEKVQRYGQRFINELTFIFTKLERNEDIMIEICQLAKRLSLLGGTPDQYVFTGECFIKALKHVNGNLWNKETEESWFCVYGMFCNSCLNTDTLKKSTGSLL
jgi:hemoglobin-like flavoprotein